MRISALPNTQSIRLEVTHRCGHVHGYRVENLEAANRVNQAVASNACPMCMATLQEVVKDGGVTEVREDWGDRLAVCQEAVATFLRAINPQHFEGKTVTLVDDSQVENKGGGRFCLHINVAVR